MWQEMRFQVGVVDHHMGILTMHVHNRVLSRISRRGGLGACPPDCFFEPSESGSEAF